MCHAATNMQTLTIKSCFACTVLVCAMQQLTCKLLPSSLALPVLVYAMHQCHMQTLYHHALLCLYSTGMCHAATNMQTLTIKPCFACTVLVCAMQQLTCKLLTIKSCFACTVLVCAMQQLTCKLNYHQVSCFACTVLVCAMQQLTCKLLPSSLALLVQYWYVPFCIAT